MGGKNNQPPGADPLEMIEQMARYNRIDQHTPTGSVTFTGDDRNIANVELSPEQLALFEGRTDLTQTALDQMRDTFGQQGPGVGEGMFGSAADEMNQLASVIGGLPIDGLDLSALSALPGIDDFGAERSRVEEATFDRMMGLIDPKFADRQTMEEQRLANRGVPELGKLAEAISGRRGRDYSTAVTGAGREAVLAGGAEQSRLFKDALAGRGQGLRESLADIGTRQQTRDQLFREIMGTFGAGRGGEAEQFNRLAALLGMSQINQPGAGMAGFWQPGQVDVTGANQTAQNAWGMGQEYSMQNQLMDLAGTLGGAALGSMTL